jgi:signal transduction histidine kinase
MEDPKMPGALTHRLLERIRLPRRPARTARLRLTALHGGLFLLCGVVLLGILYLLFTWTTGKLPQVNPPPASVSTPLAAKEARMATIAAQIVASDRDQLMINSIIALGIVTVVAVTARRISASSLRERLNLPGPDDELKDLGDTLDDLFARLETSFEAQRRFVANASHELRTPLTMMRTALDVATCKPHPAGQDVTILAAKMRRGLDQADRLLESFLMLARAQNGSFTGGTAVSLGQLASAALAGRNQAIAAMQLTIEQAGHSFGGSSIRG